MEIERKFILKELPGDLDMFDYYHIEQGYISTEPVIRIRHKEDSVTGDRYILTVKSGGLMVHEEYEIDMEKDSYTRLIAKTEGNIISKTRYLIPLDGGLTMELDVFDGAFAGLVLAEIEFPDEKTARDYIPPEFVAEDVTEDGRFHNSRMSEMTDREILDLTIMTHHDE